MFDLRSVFGRPQTRRARRRRRASVHANVRCSRLRHTLLAEALACALIFQLLVLPLSPAFANGGSGGGASGSESAENAESFNFSDDSAAGAEAMAEDGAESAVEGRTAPISSAGAFTESVAIDLPPGRGEETPALALTYASDGAKASSPVGAGWSFGAPQIARSSAEGAPAREAIGSGLRYATSGPFDGPGGRLVAAPSGEGAFSGEAGGALFMAQREHEPVRYEWVASDDRWVEHLPSGTKRYYGAAPAGLGTDAARVVDERGTSRWLLVATVDFDGNVAEYRYHDAGEQYRVDLAAPQRLPVLAEVAWGANTSGLSHVFRATTTVEALPAPAATQLMVGRTTLDRRITGLEVRGPSPAIPGEASTADTLYWSYRLAYETSGDTGRSLLTRVERRPPGVTSSRCDEADGCLVWQFEYSGNQGLGAPWGPRQALPAELAHVYQDRENLGANNYPIALESRSALTPLYRRSGTRFTDLDADGDTDVLYHPAGLRATSSRVRFEALQGPVGGLAEGALGGFVGPVGTFFSYGIPSKLLVREMSDVDADLDADALAWPVTIELETGRRDTTFYDYDRPVNRWDANLGGFLGGGPRDPGGCNPTLEACPDPHPLEGGHLPSFQGHAIPFRLDGLQDGVAELSFDVDAFEDEVAFVDPEWLRQPYRNPGEYADFPAPAPSVASCIDGVLCDHCRDPNWVVWCESGSEGAPPTVNAPTCSIEGSYLEQLTDLDQPIEGLQSDIESASPSYNAGSFPQASSGLGGGRPGFESRPFHPCRRLLLQCDRCPPPSPGDIGENNVPARPEQSILVAKNQARGNAETVYTTPLSGWPAMARSAVYLRWLQRDASELVGSLFDPRDWAADVQVQRDFHAPIVDLDGDGQSDIVLLKAMRPSVDPATTLAGTPPSQMYTFFVPRVYLSDGVDFASDFDLGEYIASRGDVHPNVANALFAGAGAERDDAEYTASLLALMNGGDALECWRAHAACAGGGHCAPSMNLCNQSAEYRVTRNFNAFFADVNGDGLPDFVRARAPLTGSVACTGGHDVHLNTGAGFELTPSAAWSAPETNVQSGNDATQHPLSLLFNRDALCAGIPNYDESLPTRPMSTMQPVDINADGRVDFVFAGRVGAGFSAGPLEHHVFLNTGHGFEVADAGDWLPSDVVFGHYDVLKRVDELPDTGRLSDLDGDGLVDAIYPGVCQIAAGLNEACEPPSWRRNLRAHPDLLTGVERTGGSWTDVTYAAARRVATDPGQLPPDIVVATRIERAAGRSAGAWAPFRAEQVERIDVSYANYVREEGSRRALGFERVTARFQNQLDGALGEVFTRETTYNVEPGAGPVSYPRKGTPVRVVMATGGTVITKTPTYSVEPIGGGVRVRPETTSTETCEAGQCLASGSRITLQDAFGYPKRQVSGRWSGSDVVVNEERTETYQAYLHESAAWRLALPTSTKVFGYRERIGQAPESAALLSQVTATYAAGRLDTETTLLDPSAGAACGAQSPPSATRSYQYNAYGQLRAVLDDTGAAGVRRVDNAFDRWHLAVETRSTYVTPQGGSQVTLTAQHATDPRFGSVYWRRDPNGSVVRSVTDDRGRATATFGPTGALTSAAAYADSASGPSTVVTRTYTREASGPLGERYVDVKHFVDGAGQVLAAVEHVPGTATAPETIRRTGYTVYDAFGQARITALPRAGAASLDDVALLAGELSARTDFDGLGREVARTTPDGRTTLTTQEVSLEASPRFVVRTTDPRGGSTVHVLDALSRHARTERFDEVGALMSATDFVRDGLGQVVRVVDGDGLERRLEYDEGGRLVAVTLPHEPGTPGGAFETCFNADGQAVRSTTPAGRSVSTQYDVLGRRVHATVSMPGGLSESIGFTYDDAAVNGLGRLTQYTDSAGTWHFTYDAWGRTDFTAMDLSPSLLGSMPAGTAASYGQGAVHGLGGQLEELQLYGLGGSGTRLVFDHDAKARTTFAAAEDASGTRTLVRDVAYDAQERPTWVRYGDETTGRFGFDWASGFLTSVRFEDAAGATLGGADYPLVDYDALGNPTRETRLGGGAAVVSEKRHAFDAMNRLTATELDLGGTTTTDTTHYSPGGRIVRAGGRDYGYTERTLAQAAETIGDWSYTYDADGFVTFATDGTTTRELEWDGAGCLRLVRETTPAEVTETRNVCRLGGARMYRDTENLTTGARSRVLYLPGSEVRFDEDLALLKVPVAGHSVAELGWSLSSGDFRDDASGFVHADPRGSVLAKTRFDSSGVPERAAEYTAWGETRAVAGFAAPRHQYVGHEPDEGTGLLHFGRRVYDPAMRRWLSPDPLLLGSPELDAARTTQLDLWGYAGGNPVAFTDESGLYAETLWDAFSIAVGVESLVRNVSEGNYAEAAVDGVGVALDVAAAVLPVVPGGASVAIRATREAVDVARTTRVANRAVDVGTAARSADRTTDVARTTERTTDAASRAERASDGTRLDDGCFVAGTLVWTEGGLKPIQEVTAGEWVWSRDAATQEPELHQVEETFVREGISTLEVTIGDGDVAETYETTAEHPFWVNGRGWVEAQSLRPGDLVLSLASGWLRVGAATWTQRRATVYNFSVAGTRSYLVGDAGTWVHNADCIDPPGGGDSPQGGIYEFPDRTAPGQTYVGQSGNVQRRLAAHERAGRLEPGTEATTVVEGGRTAREVAEHRRIQQHTAGVPARQSDAVSNRVDPIGPRRRHLLEDE